MYKRRELVRVAGLSLMMIVVGSGFLGSLGLAFHYYGGKAPPVIENNFRVGLMVFLLSSVVAAVFIKIFHGDTWTLRPQSRFGLRMRWTGRTAPGRLKEEYDRLQRLALDPATRKYVALIEQGNQWTDDQIAYDRDPDLLITCAHLQTVEHAMRRAGVRVKRVPFIDQRLEAYCCIDMKAIEQHLGVKAPVIYAIVGGDRLYDPESVSLHCTQHSSSIAVVNPDEAKPDTPLFTGREREVMKRC